MAADDPSPGHGPPAPEWHWRPWSAGDPAEPLAREWLAQRLGVAPGDLRLARGAHGRPQLDPGHGADASWSHSGEGLLLAFARGARVGVDLERLRARPRALELARRFFTAAEADWLQAHAEGPARDTAFLRLWCAKEAVLKAHGRGLAFGLDKLEFAERDGALALAGADPALGDSRAWRLLEFVPHPGYRAALAWRPT